MTTKKLGRWASSPLDQNEQHLVSKGFWDDDNHLYALCSSPFSAARLPWHSPKGSKCATCLEILAEIRQRLRDPYTT